ncbi:MAG: DUF5667 domain-containing protein [Patescibacteria group bacterium]
MNTFFDQFKKEALNIKLSATEKQVLRVRLHKAMRPETHTKIRSPYAPDFFFLPKIATSMALLLIVALVSGTAFAAENSLPGEPLYAIKVNVNERVAGALALTDEAKAEWHTQVAEVRLEEAEKLASLGRLDASKSAEIEDNFNTHAQSAEDIAERIKKDDPDTSNRLTAKRSALLRAHDSILVRVGKESNDDDSEKLASGIAQRIRTRSEKKESIATSSVFSISTTISSDKENEREIKALVKAEKIATTALENSKEKYEDLKESLDSDTKMAVELQLNLLSAKLEGAQEVMEYTEVLRDTTVLKAFLKASKKLNRNLFSRPEKRGGGDGNDDVDTSTSSQKSSKNSDMEEEHDSFTDDLLRDR